VGLLEFILATLVVLVPAWRICTRVGLTPWWSLAVVVPVLGYLALALRLAFGPWPNPEGRG